MGRIEGRPEAPSGSEGGVVEPSTFSTDGGPEEAVAPGDSRGNSRRQSRKLQEAPGESLGGPWMWVLRPFRGVDEED